MTEYKVDPALYVHREDAVGALHNISIVENFIGSDVCSQFVEQLQDSTWERTQFNYGDRTRDKSQYIVDLDLISAEVARLASIHFGVDLVTYPAKGGFTKWVEGDSLQVHSDAQAGDCSISVDEALDAVNAPAIILYSALVYFNDDYTGGELRFPFHDMKIAPSTGTLIMFPATCMYPHEVLTVTKGERYTYNVFLSNKSLIDMFTEMKDRLTKRGNDES